MALYINGKPVAVGGSAVANYGSSGYPFNIGATVLDATGNYFNGRIDEVAVYNKALTADEICQMYAAAVGRTTRIELAPTLLVLDSKPAGTLHDGINLGAAWLPTSDTRSGVMQFAAAEGDQITVAPNADFNSPTGTIMFWMRSAGNVGSGNEGALLFDRRTGAGDVIVLWDADGSIFIQPEWMYGANSTAKVADNVWHHVAYVYDQSASGSVKVYIDGVLDIDRANPRAWSWPALAQIELGRSHDGWWKIYDGQLDDVRIYNRTLDATEIGQAMAGDVVSPTELMVRFDFDAAPSNGLILTWPLPCGTLQQTDAILNDGATIWTDVPGATSPYLLRVTEPMRFFRMKY
jgi:hypothetical protein